MPRKAKINRKTKETIITVESNIDGTGSTSFLNVGTSRPVARQAVWITITVIDSEMNFTVTAPNKISLQTVKGNFIETRSKKGN